MEDKQEFHAEGVDKISSPPNAMKNVPLSNSSIPVKKEDVEKNHLQPSSEASEPMDQSPSNIPTEFALPRKELLVSSVEPAPSENGSAPPMDIMASAVQDIHPAGQKPDEHVIPPVAMPSSPEPPSPLPDKDVLERTRSLWREIDPTDLSDPVDPTDKDIKKGICGEILVGASRRGRSHAHDGKYREDSFAFDVQDTWIFIAVADGTGSKPLARVGAKTAANSALGYLKTRLMSLHTNDQAPSTLRGALAGAMVHALAEISDEAACRQKEANDFATTLLLVAYGGCDEKRWLGIAQVGDGGIAIQKQNGECIQVGSADHGRFGGEAVFLTSQEAQMTWNQRAIVYEVQDAFQRLIVATDGVFDDFSPPFGQTERLFDDLQPISEQADAAAWLLEWLNYERRGSFDDRTLVVLTPNMG